MEKKGTNEEFEKLSDKKLNTVCGGNNEGIINISNKEMEYAKLQLELAESLRKSGYGYDKVHGK